MKKRATGSMKSSKRLVTRTAITKIWQKEDLAIGSTKNAGRPICCPTWREPMNRTGEKCFSSGCYISECPHEMTTRYMIEDDKFSKCHICGSQSTSWRRLTNEEAEKGVYRQRPKKNFFRNRAIYRKDAGEKGGIAKARQSIGFSKPLFPKGAILLNGPLARIRSFQFKPLTTFMPAYNYYSTPRRIECNFS